MWPGPLGWTAAALGDRGTHSFRVKVVWAPRTAADFLTQMELAKTMGISGVPVFVTAAGKTYNTLPNRECDDKLGI